MMSLNEYKLILRDILTPNTMVETVEDIPLEELYDRGYGVLLCDIDNTLLRLDERQLSLQKLQWLMRAKAIGFRVYFISNNSSHRRIERVGVQADVKGIHFAMKPLPFSTQTFAKENSILLSKAVFIGDKLLTDVITGNWLRCYTVLVDPLNKKTSLAKTLQRDIELGLIRLLK